MLAVYEEVEYILVWQFDALADDVAELVRGQIGRSEVPNYVSEICAYLFRSVCGNFEFGARSQIMGILSGYFSRIFADSSKRVSGELGHVPYRSWGTFPCRE